MSIFRDSLNKDEAPARPEPQGPADPLPAQHPASETPDQTPGADDTFSGVEDAEFEEVTAPSISSSGATSSYAAGSGASGISTSRRRPSRRHLLWGLVAASAVIMLLFAVISKGPNVGSSADSPGKAATPDSVDPQPADVDPDTGPAPAPATPGDEEDEDEDEENSDSPRANLGFPTAAEKAAARKRLARGAEFVRRSDHPADGKPGVLVNDAKRFAAVMERELGMKVITEGTPEPEELRVIVERKVGLMILMTTAGEKRIPFVERVPINTTGITAD